MDNRPCAQQYRSLNSMSMRLGFSDLSQSCELPLIAISLAIAEPVVLFCVSVVDT